MKKKVITMFLVMAAMTAILGVSSASASMTWTIEQVGADVVISTEGGTLDVSNLTFAGVYALTPGFRGGWARICSANGDTEFYYEGGFSCDDQLGSSLGLIDADSASGEYYFFQDNGIAVPVGYVSGDTLEAATITFENTTLADMELSVGGHATYSWDGDSVSVNVVPEPATMALLGLGGLMIRRRRKS